MKLTMQTRYSIVFLLPLLLGLLNLRVVHAETALGAPVTRPDAGLTITAAYEAPLSVDGSDTSNQPLFLSPDKADLFLAVNIRGGKGNKNGFGVGEFIPYLSVSYTLQRHGGGELQRGYLHSLVGPKGMRYGNNVKLSGSGSYTLTLTIEPPIKVGFGRHTDLETGVSKWWKQIQVEWPLEYSALAK
jgi:uncharacterized protein involved in high-affinity Fe2+ transport